MLRRALRIRKPVFLPFLVGVMLALASVSPAVAARPTAQDLNPAPADFYSCHPVGAGTICRAHTVDPYENEPTGILCGDGVSAVEILDSGIRDVDATRWYDSDGNLTRRLRLFLFRDAYLSNPATGGVLPYTQLNMDNEDLGVPGDLGSVTLMGHGHLSITAPGFGPVLIGAGRTVIGPEGDVLAESGVSRLDADALCAALGSPNQ
jgi:hypothetical protein